MLVCFLGSSKINSLGSSFRFFLISNKIILVNIPCASSIAHCFKTIGESEKKRVMPPRAGSLRCIRRNLILPCSHSH